ncbi:hypothetical protein AC579_946 [Pseudocercospora musae]|uniref:Uncharacterized protein n=1 Tax=Pseudocercospora musae TaxID=113226 RepID=A0A139IUI2_9PEZI|nr:hypothetical protein AC579_946 [Pseudocercospora musae]
MRWAGPARTRTTPFIAQWQGGQYAVASDASLGQSAGQASTDTTKILIVFHSIPPASSSNFDTAKLAWRGHEVEDEGIRALIDVDRNLADFVQRVRVRAEMPIGTDERPGRHAWHLRKTLELILKAYPFFPVAGKDPSAEYTNRSYMQIRVHHGRLVMHTPSRNSREEDLPSVVDPPRLLDIKMFMLYRIGPSLDDDKTQEVQWYRAAQIHDRQ